MNPSRRQLLLGTVAFAAALAVWPRMAMAASPTVVAGGHGQMALGAGGGTTAPLNITGANTILVWANYGQTGTFKYVPPMVDSLGNVYKNISTIFNPDSTVAFFLAQNVTGGVGTTWRFQDAQIGGGVINVVSVAGGDTVRVLDLMAQNQSTTNQATISAGPIFPFQNNDLILSYLVNYTAGATQACAGFTIIDRLGSGVSLAQATAQQTQTSAASVSAAWSWTGNQQYQSTFLVAISSVPSGSLKTVKYACDYLGDIPNILPYGNISAMTWAAGTVTVTTADGALSAIRTGAVMKTVIGVNASPYQGGGSFTGVYNATVTGTNTFTYPLASNPGTWGAALTQWSLHPLNVLTGATGGSPNISYASSGKTCSGNGTSTTILLDATETAACLFHPILWNGNYYLITAFNAGTHTASITAAGTPFNALPSGYAGTFSGGPPASGDPYWIPMVNPQFDLGLSGAGQSQWTLDTGYYNGGTITLDTFGSNLGLGAVVTFNSTLAPNASLVAPGTIGNGSGVALITGQTANNCPNTALFKLGGDTVFTGAVHGWQKGPASNGVFAPFAGDVFNVVATKALFRSDAGGFSMNADGFFFRVFYLDTCIMITSDTSSGQFLFDSSVSHTACSWIHTSSADTTVNTTVSSGTSIIVNNAAGVPGLSITANAVPFVSHPAVSQHTCATAESGAGPYTFTIGADSIASEGGAITGTLTTGDAIKFMYKIGLSGYFANGDLYQTATNSAFLGFAMLTQVSPHTGQDPFFGTTCKSDSTITTLTGITNGISFAGAIVSGYQAGTANTVDARLKPGSGLLTGGTATTGKTDWLGNLFNGEVGALAHAAPAGSGIIGGGVGSFPSN